MYLFSAKNETIMEEENLKTIPKCHLNSKASSKCSSKHSTLQSEIMNLYTGISKYLGSLPTFELLSGIISPMISEFLDGLSNVSSLYFQVFLKSEVR